MQINKSYNTGKTGQNWKGKIQSWTSEIKYQDLKLYSKKYWNELFNIIRELLILLYALIYYTTKIILKVWK